MSRPTKAVEQERQSLAMARSRASMAEVTLKGHLEDWDAAGVVFMRWTEAGCPDDADYKELMRYFGGAGQRK